MNKISSRIKPVILMTATVNQEGTDNTTLQVAAIRKQHYVEAIRFYLDNTDLNIIICENTETKFYNEIESYNNNKSRLEFLTFRGNDYDKSRGKGFGEAQIIKFALEHSRFIKESDYLIKITGRVRFSNIDKILNSIRYSPVIF